MFEFVAILKFKSFAHFGNWIDYSIRKNYKKKTMLFWKQKNVAIQISKSQNSFHGKCVFKWEKCEKSVFFFQKKSGLANFPDKVANYGWQYGPYCKRLKIKHHPVKLCDLNIAGQNLVCFLFRNKIQKVFKFCMELRSSFD